MRIFTLVPALLLVLVVASGCEKEASSTDTASSVEGLLALDTFTAAPTEVAATDENGSETTSSVGEDGSFHLGLQKGHDYQLSVHCQDGDVPVVLPQPDGSLARSFHVSSNGARVSLGRVRQYANAPEQGFVVTAEASEDPASTAATITDAGPQPTDKCVDGVLSADQRPCVEHRKQAQCRHGHRRGHERRDHGARSHAGSADHGHRARLAVDGGLPALGEGDRAHGERDGGNCRADGDVVNPKQRMAVPSVTPPPDMGGCDDADDTEDGTPSKALGKASDESAHTERSEAHD